MNEVLCTHSESNGKFSQEPSRVNFAYKRHRYVDDTLVVRRHTAVIKHMVNVSWDSLDSFRQNSAEFIRPILQKKVL